MTKNLIKIALLCVVLCLGIQLSQASPADLQKPNESDPPADAATSPTTEEQSNPSADPSAEVQSPSASADESPNLTPTDPLELNKMAFHSLLKLYGKIGPLIYTLLTEKNALGDQMGVVSEVIVDRINLKNYSDDMEVIFSNLLNPLVKEKLMDVYDKIKDISVQNDPNRNLAAAVEIIQNVLDDDTAVAQIDNILKTGSI